MIPFVLAGVGLFPVIALGLAHLHDRRSDRLANKEEGRA